MRLLKQRMDFLETEVEALKKKLIPIGKPGTGACICPASPEHRLREMERMGEALSTRYHRHNDAVLDHRCPKHGEKAQPAVWGRHKELQLGVTFKEWESLSVSYEEQTT